MLMCIFRSCHQIPERHADTNMIYWDVSATRVAQQLHVKCITSVTQSNSKLREGFTCIFLLSKVQELHYHITIKDIWLLNTLDSSTARQILKRSLVLTLSCFYCAMCAWKVKPPLALGDPTVVGVCREQTEQQSGRLRSYQRRFNSHCGESELQWRWHNLFLYIYLWNKKWIQHVWMVLRGGKMNKSTGYL